VKGFAVTLAIGIAASMFTAIFVSRVIFETIFSLRRLVKLSI
jgi:preprotein translocase subunit SecD